MRIAGSSDSEDELSEGEEMRRAAASVAAAARGRAPSPEPEVIVLSDSDDDVAPPPPPPPAHARRPNPVHAPAYLRATSGAGAAARAGSRPGNTGPSAGGAGGATARRLDSAVQRQLSAEGRVGAGSAGSGGSGRALGASSTAARAQEFLRTVSSAVSAGGAGPAGLGGGAAHPGQGPNPGRAGPGRVWGGPAWAARAALNSAARAASGGSSAGPAAGPAVNPDRSPAHGSAGHMLRGPGVRLHLPPGTGGGLPGQSALPMGLAPPMPPHLHSPGRAVGAPGAPNGGSPSAYHGAMEGGFLPVLTSGGGGGVLGLPSGARGGGMHSAPGHAFMPAHPSGSGGGGGGPMGSQGLRNGGRPSAFHSSAVPIDSTFSPTRPSSSGGGSASSGRTQGGAGGPWMPDQRGGSSARPAQAQGPSHLQQVSPGEAQRLQGAAGWVRRVHAVQASPPTAAHSTPQQLDAQPAWPGQAQDQAQLGQAQPGGARAEAVGESHPRHHPHAPPTGSPAHPGGGSAAAAAVVDSGPLAGLQRRVAWGAPAPVLAALQGLRGESEGSMWTGPQWPSESPAPVSAPEAPTSGADAGAAAWLPQNPSPMPQSRSPAPQLAVLQQPGQPPAASPLVPAAPAAMPNALLGGADTGPPPGPAAPASGSTAPAWGPLPGTEAAMEQDNHD